MAYARAYELVPVSSADLIFPAEWIDPAMYRPDQLDLHWGMTRNVAIVDFAFTEKTRVSDDPDWSVCVIATITHDGHAYPRDILRQQTTFPNFKRQAIALGQKWNISEMAAEANGPQRGLVQQMNEDAPFPVIGIERTKDKITRASEAQPFVESGRLHLPMESPGKPVKAFEPVYDELTQFPAAGHDDTVDVIVDMIQRVRRQPMRVEAPPRVRQTRRTIYG